MEGATILLAAVEGEPIDDARARLPHVTPAHTMVPPAAQAAEHDEAEGRNRDFSTFILAEDNEGGTMVAPSRLGTVPHHGCAVSAPRVAAESVRRTLIPIADHSVYFRSAGPSVPLSCALPKGAMDVVPVKSEEGRSRLTIASVTRSGPVAWQAQLSSSRVTPCRVRSVLGGKRGAIVVRLLSDVHMGLCDDHTAKPTTLDDVGLLPSWEAAATPTDAAGLVPDPWWASAADVAEEEEEEDDGGFDAAVAIVPRLGAAPLVRLQRATVVVPSLHATRRATPSQEARVALCDWRSHHVPSRPATRHADLVVVQLEDASLAQAGGAILAVPLADVFLVTRGHDSSGTLRMRMMRRALLMQQQPQDQDEEAASVVDRPTGVSPRPTGATTTVTVASTTDRARPSRAAPSAVDATMTVLESRRGGTTGIGGGVVLRVSDFANAAAERRKQDELNRARDRWRMTGGGRGGWSWRDGDVDDGRRGRDDVAVVGGRTAPPVMRREQVPPPVEERRAPEGRSVPSFIVSPRLTPPASSPGAPTVTRANFEEFDYAAAAGWAPPDHERPRQHVPVAAAPQAQLGDKRYRGSP